MTIAMPLVSASATLDWAPFVHSDEKVIWTGKMNPGLTTRGLIAGVLIAGFMAVYAGHMALFTHSLQDACGHRIGKCELFYDFSGPIALVFLALLGFGLFNFRQLLSGQRQVFYALTQSRALVLTQASKSKLVEHDRVGLQLAYSGWVKWLMMKGARQKSIVMPGLTPAEVQEAIDADQRLREAEV